MGLYIGNNDVEPPIEMLFLYVQGCKGRIHIDITTYTLCTNGIPNCAPCLNKVPSVVSYDLMKTAVKY